MRVSESFVAVLNESAALFVCVRKNELIVAGLW